MESPTARQDIISRLCNSGEGLAVLFETVATVYQSDSPADETDGEAPADNWKVVGYGIPSIVATHTEVTLFIADFDEDLPGHEITITSSTQFMLLSDQFSVIGEHNSTYYGICFADVAVAKKIASLIVQVLPTAQYEGDGNAPKRLKLSSSSMEGESDPKADNEWVIVEHEDVQDLVEESEEARGEEEPDGEEGVDSPLLFSRKSQKRRSRSNSPRLPISEPSQYRHVSHVGMDTSVGELTRSMQAPVSSYQTTIQSHRESGTVSVSSFTEVFSSGPGGAAPPPPPPPTAPPPPPPPAPGPTKIAGAKPLPGMSLQDELLKGVTLKATRPSDSGGSEFAGSIAEELKRGITLRPVGMLGKPLPKPPQASDRTQLLFEIHTFKRNTLRHVETKSKNMTDYQNEDPNSLQTLLRSRLEKMRGKLSMRNFSRVGSVNGEGDEDGFEDEFDGPLFG